MTFIAVSPHRISIQGVSLPSLRISITENLRNYIFLKRLSKRFISQKRRKKTLKAFTPSKTFTGTTLFRQFWKGALRQNDIKSQSLPRNLPSNFLPLKTHKTLWNSSRSFLSIEDLRTNLSSQTIK